MNIIFSKHFIQKLWFFIFAMIILAPICASALVLIDNEGLDSITGQSGISLAVSHVEMFTHIDSYGYVATDGGFLALRDFFIEDGSGGPARYNFGTGAGVMYMAVGALNVASIEDWNISTDPESQYKGMFGVNAPVWDQQVAYLIPDFVFSDGAVGNEKSLGSILIGPVDMSSWHYFTAPHGSGVDFEYGFETHIDQMVYGYNESAGLLAFENIHIGNSFGYGIGGDDPANPTTWETDIGEFRIGDMFGNLNPLNLEHSTPARFDVGVIENSVGNPYGAMGLQLPLSGSVRFEKADFGGVDFGPGAIDGITAHRLELYLIP